MTFDLNLLLTFEAMDKARSVSGAARLLGLSQPATSAALSRLRAALGDELFSYAGGAMQPTPVARRLAPGLHAALTDLRGVLDAERRFDPATAQGCFAIGVTDYASAVIAPALSAWMALPHLMALPEILRATDLVAAVPARAAARFGPGVETFDLTFLGLAPWTLHMLWSPFARKDSAMAWLRDAVARVCAGL